MFDPEIEALPFEAQAAIDDVLYRRQVAYLFERSRFYREQARPRPASIRPRRSAASSASPSLPTTEKDEIRQTRSDDEPVGTHLCGPAPRHRPHLLDQRYHRHAELHPAHRERHRQLDPHFGAHLRRRRHPARRRPDLDLWRRAVRRRHHLRRLQPPRRLPHSDRRRQHRAADDDGPPAQAGRHRAHPVLRPPSRRVGARPRHRHPCVERHEAPRRRRARRRRTRHAEATRGGLGRDGHRGDGDRRHRGLAVGRMPGEGRHAFQRPRASSISS